MRILNEDEDKALGGVTLFLTMSEASELRDSLNGMLADPIGHDHEHVSSNDYKKEVTVCIYSADNPDQFDDRSKRLIIEDI